ncbi:MAG: glycosyltransferase family A protein, partial [bacterium]
MIPTYNREALLREAVASVVSQTFGDWELIVADDGSTDETRQYLSEVRDPRVRPLMLAHCGNAARVRNAAVAQARGTWVAFLDSDDLWHPGKLELQLLRAALHPECGWSCTGFEFIDASGSPIPQRAGKPYVAHSGWIAELLLEFAATATTQSLMVRRDVLAEVGGFDDAFL